MGQRVAGIVKERQKGSFVVLSCMGKNCWGCLKEKLQMCGRENADVSKGKL